MYALNEDGVKITALKGVDGFCPLCKSLLVVKCGDVNVWHWSHKSVINCDSWSEGETKWHVDWKKRFPESCREVVIVKDGVKHIADIYLKEIKLVIEMQNSPINRVDVFNREYFYDKMFWIFNMTSVMNNFVFNDRGGWVGFRWKWPKKSLLYCNKPLFFDFSGRLFRVKTIYNDSYVGGWGYWVTDVKKEFRKAYKEVHNGSE
jgi:hypothetical protein